jgi:hypothetical protein
MLSGRKIQPNLFFALVAQERTSGAPTGMSSNRQKHVLHLTKAHGRPGKNHLGQMRPLAFAANDLALDQHVISLTCRGSKAGTSVCEGLK